MRSPVPGEKQPQAQRHTGSHSAGKRLHRSESGGAGENQTGHELAVCSCHWERWGYSGLH